ncbi:hypothetical protein HHI36_000723 [Cryptolaemus montrouzieri]|uniref:Reverse transcriptase domain-containing protein n=1 Tax=Cryptolaemus montrouzieri TaxID=559131 RepID=A0ABD2P667_9CUCU
MHMTLVEISTEDVRVAFSNIKNGKAPRMGNTHEELLKAAPSRILDVLTKLFNECSRGSEPPTDCKRTEISPGAGVIAITTDGSALYARSQDFRRPMTLSELWDCGKVLKSLRQCCSLTPNLFKIFLQEVLSSWTKKFYLMGISIGDITLYTLLFADYQVIVAGDRDDAAYMLRKLEKRTNKWGTTINIKKTAIMVVGDDD